MAVSKSLSKKQDQELSEKALKFIQDGAPTTEDIKQEEVIPEKKPEPEKWTMISMRIPEKLLKEMDEVAKKRYMNRSAWLIELIQEKLRID